jgi:hypothetical protein
MKYLAFTSLLVLIVSLAGCSSSKESTDSMDSDTPPWVVGAWVPSDGSSGSFQFLANGDFLLEQGDLLASINRFQNTDRVRYLSRLVHTGTYEYDDAGQLTLHVMADWTGKGTGARRAPDKSVSSSIVFDIEGMDGGTLTLQKVSMNQSGSDADDMNSDEALSFSLKRQP